MIVWPPMAVTDAGRSQLVEFLAHGRAGFTV
jgi:hypothetical protein